MEKKLTWDKIEKLYNRQWVQLIQYDWPEREALPRAGVVRVHAKTRQEFDRLIAREPQKNSALLFVGERKIPPGVLLSANLHQWKRLDA
jgi:hypothetical protein